MLLSKTLRPIVGRKNNGLLLRMLFVCLFLGFFSSQIKGRNNTLLPVTDRTNI